MALRAFRLTVLAAAFGFRASWSFVSWGLSPAAPGRVETVERLEPVGLVLTAECRELRRALSPMAWTVLEEVVLDAVVVGGRIVAATSARRIAAQLELDVSTAAKALRVLRNCHVLDLERQSGPAGRFGLASYAVIGAPGVRLVRPRGDAPHMADASMDHHVAAPGAVPRTKRECAAVAGPQAAFELDW